MASNASRTAAPVIGVTTYLQRARSGVWDVDAAFLPRVYLDGVVAAGGIPVLLAPQPLDGGVADAVIARLDGLLVAGGVDVDPARYGQDPHPETDRPQPLRDDWDTALLQSAIAADLPFLAICRGAQVLNVLRGGTLHQHLPDVVGSTRYQPGGGEFSQVPVAVDAGSRLHGIVGDALTGDVYHHQAIDRVGEGLRVTARSDDGVVEALELPEASFGVAVQWHPEQNPEDVRLFESLVEAARDFAAARATEAGA